MIEHRAVLATWLVARTVGMRRGTLDVLVDATAAGVLEYYGRASPVGFERAERVERERRKAYARSGHRARMAPRLQVYAPGAAGGLGVMHFYARAAAAFLDQVDLALNGSPVNPLAVAFSSAVARVAVQLGYVPSVEAPTPLDFWPTHLVDVLRYDQRVEAFYLYTLHAGLRPTSSVALREADDSSLAAARWVPPNDGGGAELWPRYGLWSRFLVSQGAVRWADIFGGIEWRAGERRFGGYWMSFQQFIGYYDVPSQSLTPAQWARAEAEHTAPCCGRSGPTATRRHGCGRTRRSAATTSTLACATYAHPSSRSRTQSPSVARPMNSATSRTSLSG